MVKDDRRRLIASLEIVTGVGLVLFWIAFLTLGLAPENASPCYFTYEHSFPLPDGILAVSLLIAGILLMKSHPAGRIISLICAGALIFLGLLDFSFNLQNGIYIASVVDLVLNAFINLWCLAFGLVICIVTGRMEN